MNRIRLRKRLTHWMGVSTLGCACMCPVWLPAVESQADPVTLSLETRTSRLDYVVGKDGALTCRVMDLASSQWFPVGGGVFPGKTVVNEHGHVCDLRYSQPVSVTVENGDNSLELVHTSHAVMRESPNVEHATIVLSDRVHPVRVELHVRAYRDESIFEQWIVLLNNGGEPLSVRRMDALFLQSKGGSSAWLEWYESLETQEAATPSRAPLGKGLFVLENTQGNRHVNGPEPFFTLGFGELPTEDKGVCLVAGLTWSGSTRLAFKVDEFNILETSCGVNQPRPVPVDPGASIATPTCVYTLSSAGKGPASRNFHRWMRHYGLRDGDRLRLVDNNSWEGCQMNVSETAVIEMMKLSADLGIELYVMDDGWFGNGAHARTNATAGLGDWQLNRERFPNGLAPVLKAAKEYNIEFGIWFEPEMINVKSDLMEKHPEWVMRLPERDLVFRRNQLVLDIANPDVQDFMFDSVNDMLTAYPDIRFVKWDANSGINNPYSPDLGPDRQGEMLYRYMAGYYGVLAKLVAAHPQVDFQACAAGGGRADLGAMKYSHTFWPSDNTDPAYRLGAIWNFSLCMPPLAATCHVTHAGKGSAKFRFDVAMLGQLGMEVDPRKAPPEYLAAAKVGIAAYKSVRDIVQFGDQYRHLHPFDSETPSLNYVSADRKRALVLAYQTGTITRPEAFTSPLQGLDSVKTYRAVEINLPPGDDQPRLAPDAELVRTGREWMKSGVPLIFTRKTDSAAITLEAIESR